MSEASYYDADCKYDPCAECPIAKLTPEQQNICMRGLDIVERKREFEHADLDKMTVSQGFSAVIRNAVGGKTYVEEGHAVIGALELRIRGECRIEEDIF